MSPSVARPLRVAIAVALIALLPAVVPSFVVFDFVYVAVYAIAILGLIILIALVMLATLAAVVVEIVRGPGAPWVGWASLAAIVPPIALARVRTVPNAVRLGARNDPRERQSALARVIYRDHIACAAAILTLLVLQLAFA